MPALTAPAVLDSLPLVRDYAMSRAREAGVPDQVLSRLDLVIEEVFVNVTNHAYDDGNGDVEIECAPSGRKFCCTIRDTGSPFNPLDTPQPAKDQDIDQRPIGGLGLFFVSEMTDDRSYERRGDTNELTLCFFF